MPLPNFIKNVFAGGAGELVEKVGTAIDKLTISKEEKEQFKAEYLKETNSHIEKMVALAQAETDSYLKDVASAREANAAIQSSDKASWLSKNVAYIIDLFLTILWGSITVILFLKVFKVAATEVDMVSLMALHGTATAVFMTVVNFHRGTSKGSEDKSKQISSMINSK